MTVRSSTESNVGGVRHDPLSVLQSGDPARSGMSGLVGGTMNLMVVLLILALIPMSALIDYFTRRKKFEQIYGESMKWTHYLIPCAVEGGMLLLGYFLGSMEVIP